MRPPEDLPKSTKCRLQLDKNIRQIRDKFERLSTGWSKPLDWVTNLPCTNCAPEVSLHNMIFSHSTLLFTERPPKSARF